MRTWAATAIILVGTTVSRYVSAAEPATNTSMTDAEIKSILQDRIDRAKVSVGMVVGIVDDKGTRIIAYGKPRLDANQAVDGDTIFEIGSITKTFTATLLTDMIERGEVDLHDPISKYLPKTVKSPTRNGKEIELWNLATHTAALPRELDPPKKDWDDVCTVEQFYEGLSHCTLTGDIGSQFSYSNAGVKLLGHILALCAGSDYEELLRTRICQPLHMDSTTVTVPADAQERLATGYTAFLAPVSEARCNPSLAGAGGLHSTAIDLLKFISANLGINKGPLTPALEKTHAAQREFNWGAVGLDWFIRRKPDSEIISHGGMTLGFSSFVGFDKKNRRGIVVLSNSFYSVDDIALHLLDSRYPLAKPSVCQAHKAARIDAKLFDPCVGTYCMQISGPSPDYASKSKGMARSLLRS